MLALIASLNEGIYALFTPAARPLRASLYIISFCMLLVVPIFHACYPMVFAAGVAPVAAALPLYGSGGLLPDCAVYQPLFASPSRLALIWPPRAKSTPVALHKT